MTTLRNRSYILTFGVIDDPINPTSVQTLFTLDGTSVSKPILNTNPNLTIDIDIPRDLSENPSQGTLTIYNLSESKVSTLIKTVNSVKKEINVSGSNEPIVLTGVFVDIQLGYNANRVTPILSSIGRFYLLSVDTVVSGGDRVTTLEIIDNATSDIAKGVKSIIQFETIKDTQIGTSINELSSLMLATLSSEFISYIKPIFSQSFQITKEYNDSVKFVLRDILQEFGLGYRYDNGVIKPPVEDDVLNLKSSQIISFQSGLKTRLISEPDVQVRYGNGIVKKRQAFSFDTYIIPNLKPGFTVRISPLVYPKNVKDKRNQKELITPRQRDYKIYSIRYIGSSNGDEWKCEIDAYNV